MRKPPAFGKPPKRPSAKAPKPEDLPAPRRYELEREICKAVDAKRRIELRFEDDRLWRLYEPHGVYTSTKDKILTTGNQVSNPNVFPNESGSRHFEVGNIREVRITDQPFTVSPDFDRFDARYSNGFLCVIKIL